MGTIMRWSDKERKLLQKYFETKWTTMTLYQRIHKINPFRSYESITRELRRMRKGKGRFVRDHEVALSKMSVGYLDIETTNLNADFGHMLSWYIKKRGKNEYDFAVITKQEIFDQKFDERITRELLLAMAKYDRIYTHYGSDRRFDIPFIRTRAFAHGLEKMLPQAMEVFIFDTYPIARNKLKLHSNRLDSIAQALNVADVKKTPLSGKLWNLARVGDKKSLEYVALHNKRDVQLLERVHRKLECVERPIYRSI